MWTHTSARAKRSTVDPQDAWTRVVILLGRRLKHGRHTLADRPDVVLIVTL